MYYLLSLLILKNTIQLNTYVLLVAFKGLGKLIYPISLYFRTMKRKIIQMAGKTMLVSLPSSWVKKYGVKKGEEVEVEEQDRRIIVSTEKSYGEIKGELDLNEFDKLAKRTIGTYYKYGCDEVKIIFRKPDDIKLVEKVLNELLGFEIVSHNEKFCIIKEVSSGEKAEFDAMMRRMFLVVSSISDDCLEGLKKSDYSILKEVDQRDIAVNRLANFCRRLLNKEGYIDFRKAPMIYYILEEVENLGDEYKYLSSFIVREKVAVKNKKILDQLAEVNLLFKEFSSLYNKFENKKAEHIYAKKEEIMLGVNDLLKTKSVEEIRVLDYMARMVTIISNMLGPLMTMELP